MKKFFTCMVKLLTTLVVLAGVAFAVVTYWDKIMLLVDKISGLCCKKHSCGCAASVERDDYADWDE